VENTHARASVSRRKSIELECGGVTTGLLRGGTMQ